MKLKLRFKKLLVFLLNQATKIFGLFIIVYLLYALSNTVFVGLPKILNSTIAALPINNNAYPILLQGLLIVASMIFGLYGILLFYSSKKLNKIIDKYLDKSFIFKLFSLFFILLPLFLLTFSIFFSLNGLIYYGITIEFTKEQINTGHIPIAISNLSIENITYFNQAKNYSETAQMYYNKTLASTQSSISMIFLSTIIITAILVVYLLDIFGIFEYLYDSYNSNKMAHYAIDILIFAIIIGAFLYYKVYILIIEFIFLLILALIITYLLNYMEKKKAKQKSIDNSTIPPPR